MGKNYRISPERQQLYYFGNAISIFGGLLFLSNFCIGPGTFFSSFSTSSSSSGFTDATMQMDRMQSQALSTMSGVMVRAVLGMILIVVGQIIARAGKLGAAGSGLILDPQQAREDVEPWSRLAGGIARDVIEEVKPAFELDQNPSNTRPQSQRSATERLKELESLRDQGIVTETEYETKRKEIIDSI